MAYQRKPAAEGKNIPVGLAMSLAGSWGVTLIAASIVTILIAGEHVGESFLSAAAVGTMFLASFAGALLAAGQNDSGRLMICLGSGGVYYLSLLGCNILFFDGEYRGMIPALLTVVGSCLIAALLGTRRKRPKYKGLQTRYGR